MRPSACAVFVASMALLAVTCRAGVARINSLDDYKNSSASKYRTSVAVGSKVVAVPYQASQILVVDVEAGSFSYIQGYSDSRSYKYRTSAAVGSKVVAVPDYASEILVVDVEAGTFSYMEGYSSSRASKYRTSVAVGSKIVAVPYQAFEILVVDVEAGTFSYIEGYSDFRTWKYTTSVAIGSKVVAVPDHASQILVVDVEAGTFSYIQGYSDSSSYKYCSSVAVGSKVVAVPDQASEILVVDVEAGTFDYIKGYSGSPIYKYRTSVAVGSKVVAVPYHAAEILVVDAEAGTFSYIEDYVNSRTYKYATSAAVGSRVVAVPDHALETLVVDVKAGTFSYIEGYTDLVGEGYSEWQPYYQYITSVVVGGEVVGVPYNASDILVAGFDFFDGFLLEGVYAAIAPGVCLVFTVIGVCCVKAVVVLKLEILISAIDLSSDLFWALTETFFHKSFAMLALGIALGNSIFYTAFIMLQTRRLCPRVARDGLIRLWRAAWSGLFGFLVVPVAVRVQRHGHRQVFRAGSEGSLDKLLVNLVALLFVLIYLLVASVVSSVLLAIALVLLLALAFAASVAAYAAGVFLHATRILAVRQVHRRYTDIWRGWSEKPADEDGSIDMALFNRMIVSELILESLPSTAFNSVNMFFMYSWYGHLPSWIAWLSVATSVYMLIRVSYRYLYFVLLRGKEIEEVPYHGVLPKAAAAATVSGRHAADVGVQVVGATDDSAMGPAVVVEEVAHAAVTIATR